MRNKSAEEARLKKLYQEADNERMQLHERVRLLENEAEELCKAGHARQVQMVALKQRLDKLQQEYSIAVRAAATWEVRFDRLLRVSLGETRDVARWSAAIDNIQK